MIEKKIHRRKVSNNREECNLTQKRLLALLLGGAVLAVSLASCGTSNPASGSESAPAR